MTEEDVLQAFLNNTRNGAQRKPAPPLPIDNGNNHSNSSIDGLKEIRDEMVRVRYILEDLRRDNTRFQKNVNDGGMSEEQFQELKSMFMSTQKATDDLSTEILSRIAEIREDILRFVYAVRKNPGEYRKDDLVYSFEGYGLDIANLLTEYDVSMTPAVSTEFDPAIHQILSTVDTDDMEMHNKIAESVGDYYTKDGHVILRTRVKVYRYMKKMEKKRKPSEPSEE